MLNRRTNPQETQPAQPTNGKRKNKSLEEWDDLVRERIEEAIERGDFDNLPGQGKPLNLDANPNEPPEMRMAHKLLKNNNLAPAWILDRRGLLLETEALRTELARKWQWYSREYNTTEDETLQVPVAEEWMAFLRDCEEQIADLNRRILDLNLSLPIWRMELLRLNLDRELAKIGARRALDNM